MRKNQVVRDEKFFYKRNPFLSRKFFKMLFFSVAYLVLVLASVNSFAQQQSTVSGTLTDESGQPLPGVTVVVKGTTQGTVTNADGEYSISSLPEDATLRFSFVGMRTQEVEVGSQTTINVSMVEDAIGIEEVVAIGYGTQKKVNLTGSVATVNSEELVKVPTSSISEAIAGKASGLYSRQSMGAPGQDDVQLSIRGFDTPLVLVDGIESEWGRLDPNEIESISVLKDAAAAVYGARAGNGVILITTKRGTSTKPTITYTNNFSFQQPTIPLEFVPSWKYAELIREGELNSGLTYTYSEEDIQKFKAGNDPDYVNTNWYKELAKDWAFMQTHNLGVRGGSEKVKFYTSIGYLDQASTFRSNDLGFSRYNVRANLDAKISDRLTATVDLSYREEIRDSPNAAHLTGTALGNIQTDLNLTTPVWPAHLPDPKKGGAYAGFTTRSPLAQTQKELTGFVEDKRQYFTGKISLKYEIPGIKGLNVDATLNYYTNILYNKTQDKPFGVYSYDYANDQYAYYGDNGSNSLNESFSKFTELYPMFSLNYSNTFEKHSVQGLLLVEGIDTDRREMSAGRVDLLSMELPYLFAGSTSNMTNDGRSVETGRLSYVGRLNYSYAGKYLLEGTFRYDASYKFPKDSRWGFFPSVSAGWRVSEEPFVKDNFTWVDNLKLRASYSQAGDDNVAAFKYLTGYEIRTGNPSIYQYDVYQFGSDPYRLIETTGLPNPNITWLDMTNYNVGLDGSFMDGLFGFEFDYFFRITDNIFGQPLETYPSTFGAQLPRLNINSTDDRGFELTLNHRNKINNDFSYKVSAMVSLAREKYRKWSEIQYDDPDEIRTLKLTGNYTNRTFGYRSDGLFMTQEEIENHPVNQDQVGNTTLRPGDIKYIDRNDDKVIDWRDEEQIGYSQFPDLTYGLNLQSDYKRFSVTALFQGASKFTVPITGPLRNPQTNWGNAYEVNYKYRWKPDPDNPGVNINPDVKLPPVLGDGTGNTANNKKNSDFYMKDGTYIT